MSRRQVSLYLAIVTGINTFAFASCAILYVLRRDWPTAIVVFGVNAVVSALTCGRFLTDYWYERGRDNAEERSGEGRYHRTNRLVPAITPLELARLRADAYLAQSNATVHPLDRP